MPDPRLPLRNPAAPSTDPLVIPLEENYLDEARANIGLPTSIEYARKHGIPEMTAEDDGSISLLRALASADDPIAEVNKLKAADYISRKMKIPLGDTYGNLEALSQAWYGEILPPATFLQNIKDNWDNGEIENQIGELGDKLRQLAEAGFKAPQPGDILPSYGPTALDMNQREELIKQIQELEKKRIPVDKMPKPLQRWWNGTIQSLPMMAHGFVEGMVTGGATATAGALLAGALGAGAAPLTGGMSIPAMAAAMAQVGMTVGSNQQMIRVMGGQAYWRMLSAGVPHDVAAPLSQIEGIINGALESAGNSLALGMKIPGIGSGLKTIGQTIAEKMLITNSALEVAARMGARWLSAGAGEGLENGLQEISTMFHDQLALDMSRYRGTFPNIEPVERAEFIRRATEAFTDGLGAGLILGVASLPGGVRMDVKKMTTLRDAARVAPSKEAFIEAAKDFRLEDSSVSEAVWAQYLGKVYDAQQVKVDQALAERSAKEPATVQSRAAGTPPAPGKAPTTEAGAAAPAGLYRTDTGKLFTITKTSTESAEGLRGVIKAGDPQKGERYGFIRYETAGDQLTVKELNVETQVEDIGRELMQRLMEENPGRDIVWNPTDEAQVQLREELIADNPRGPGAGLNWFQAAATAVPLETTEPQKAGAPVDIVTVDLFTQKMTKLFNLSTDEEEGFAWLVRRMATATGQDADAWIAKFVDPEVTMAPEKAPGGGLAAGEGVAGTVFRAGGVVVNPLSVTKEEMKGRVKATFTALATADFHIAVHEFFHMVERLALTPDQILKFERALGNKMRERWTVADVERLADLFEDYLASGQAPTPELMTVFQKIAEMMKSLISFISERLGIDQPGLSPEFKEAYDALLAKPGSGLAETEVAAEAPPDIEGETPRERVIRKPVWPHINRSDVRQPLMRELFSPQPTETPTVTSIDPRVVPVQEVELSKISLSAEVPNFKEDASEAGVVEPLEGKSYIRLGTAPIVLWERTSGSLEVITGRHRLDLARRLGEATIPAQIVREADGFTAAMALTFDAESNIRDGQGTVRDYGHYFRNTSIAQEDAEARGLLDRDKGRKGFAIGRYATDGLYSLYRNGGITEGRAAAIAAASRGEPRLTDAGIKAKSLSPEELSNYLAILRTQLSPGDVGQTDLFGADESFMVEAQKVAQEAVKKLDELRSEAGALKSAQRLGREQQAKIVEKYGFKAGDREAMATRTTELEDEIRAWQNWMTDAEKQKELRERAGLDSKMLYHPNEDDFVLQPLTDEELKQIQEKEARAKKKPAAKQMKFGFADKTAAQLQDEKDQLALFHKKMAPYLEQGFTEHEATVIVANKTEVGMLLHLKPVQWFVDYQQNEFAEVNNRISKELGVVENLLGALPEEIVATFPVRRNPDGTFITARGITPQDLNKVIYDNLPLFKRMLDRSIPIQKLARELNVDRKRYNPFVQEVESMRTGKALVDDNIDDETGLPILADNGKAGKSVDFLLSTCHPTTPCKECYAARSYIRMSSVRKGFRNTVHVLIDPKGFAEKVAAEVNSYSKEKIPFVRLLGSGDLTSEEQVQAFNHLATMVDRPIHIFSRHHDMLQKLKGTPKAPFIKMGSIDSDLYDVYGQEFLARNLEDRGIVNAFLFDDPAGLPKLKALYDAEGIGIILSADHKLHKLLPKEMQSISCPCDAGERTWCCSCRQCALQQAGCFMSLVDKGVDDTGKIWKLTDPAAPDTVLPIVGWGGSPQKAWSIVAQAIIRKSIQLVRLNIRKFKSGEAKAITLKDVRYPDSQTTVDTIRDAEAYIQILEGAMAKAKKGTFELPGGEIQGAVHYSEWVRMTDPEISEGRELTEDEIAYWHNESRNADMLYHVQAQHGTMAPGFKEFSEEFMGKGEGTQHFGWGHYLTNNTSISTFYANLVASLHGKKPGVLIDGIEIGRATLDNIDPQLGYGKLIDPEVVQQYQASPDGAATWESLMDFHIATMEGLGEVFAKDLAIARAARKAGLSNIQAHGGKAVLEVTVDKTNFMPWYDHPGDDQIISIIRRAQQEQMLAGENLGYLRARFAATVKGGTGRDIYEFFQKLLGSKEAASKFFNRAVNSFDPAVMYIGNQTNGREPLNGSLDDFRIADNEYSETQFPLKVGLVTSAALDTRVPSPLWGSIRWDESLEPKTDIELQTSVSDDGSNWTNWFSADEGMITVTFDDGYSSTYDLAYPIMKPYGFRGVAYVTTNWIGEKNRMTVEQLRRLQADGWEIGGHGSDHVSSRQSFADSKEWLISHDLGHSAFAYPGGYHDPQIISDVADYYETARTIINQYQTYAPKYQLYSYAGNSGLNEVRTWIDSVVAKRAWGILTFHSIGQPDTPASVSRSDFAEIMQHLANRRLPVVTIAEAMPRLALYTNSKGDQILSSNRRYLRYRAVLQSHDGIHTPALSNVVVSAPAKLFQNIATSISSTGTYEHDAWPQTTDTAIDGFEVTPQTGLVSIRVDAWNVTGSFLRKWTETGSRDNVVTSHSMSILVPNNHYRVKQNGILVETYQASQAGEIAFKATAGRATVAFELEQATSGPSISAVTSSPTATEAKIAWTTGESASSAVDYGLTRAYGHASRETDLSPGTINHSIVLPGLHECTIYHFRVRSKGSDADAGASDDGVFTTAGTCPKAATKTHLARLPGLLTTMTESRRFWKVIILSGIIAAGIVLLVVSLKSRGSSHGRVRRKSTRRRRRHS